MGQIAERDAQLNEALQTGRILEVFKDFYHPDVTMVEATGDTTTGLEANFQREQQFFGSIREFRGGGVTQSAVNEEAGISFATQFFDCTFADGRDMKMTEVAVREWQDGKVIKETFYYPTGG